MMKATIITIAIALAIMGASCGQQKKEGSNLSLEQRRELLLKSDNAELASQIMEILDKVSPLMSEPLTFEEQKQVIDSLSSFDDAQERIEHIAKDVKALVKARKPGQFFDEVVAPVDTFFLDGAYKIYGGFDRHLNVPYTVRVLNNFDTNKIY